MKYLYLTLISAIIISCSSESETSQTVKEEMKPVSELSPCEQMDLLISQIDSIRYADYSEKTDSLMWALNIEVSVLGEACAKLALNQQFQYTPNLFEIAIAEDSLMGIISWNTELGGTMINYEHIKFWKNNEHIEIFNSLNIGNEEEGSFNDTYYSAVHRLTLADNSIVYLAEGSGQGSSCLPWFIMEAFEIEDGKLIPTNIFPDNKSMLSVNYDLCESGDYESIIRFEVISNEIIKVPFINDNYTSYYRSLHLAGNQYKFSETMDDYIPAGYAVLAMKKGNFYDDEGTNYEDAVLILRDSLELSEEVWDLPRPLIILKGTANGYELAAKGDNVVMCQDCGGVFGDPFDYVDVSYKEIEISHYGGSSERWYERYIFHLDENDNWLLKETISGGHSTFDEDGDGEVDVYEEEIKTVYDFGEVRLEDFGKN
jgi:hypothetical protein